MKFKLPNPFEVMLALWVCAALSNTAHAQTTPKSPLDDKLQACTTCHGAQGKATRDGYFPRIAGKPAGYLYNQLLNFKEGRRQYPLMQHMVSGMSGDYMHAIADYFADQHPPYAPPVPGTATAAKLALGERIVKHGLPNQEIPACSACHGQNLTGRLPAIPGLAGMPKDYLNAQIGSWRSGKRKAQEPDCMAHIVQKLGNTEWNAIASWLASQTVADQAQPEPPSDSPLPMECGSLKPTQVPKAPAGANMPGEYLAKAGNCAACHTAQASKPFAGGVPIETPYGTVYSSNLTPSKTHGLGRWTKADFWQAMHHGKSRDGHLLYPAFPYTSYTKLTRADTDALFDYLQAQTAVDKPTPEADMRFPFNYRPLLAVWRWAWFNPGEFTPNAQRGAAWNRGAYLVQGLGHCAVCHSSYDTLAGQAEPLQLAGGLVPGLGWYAPPLTARAMHQQTSEEWLHLLQTGANSDKAVYGPMADVVAHSLQHLRQADLQAMVVYLQNPGVKAAASDDATVKALPDTAFGMAQGKAIYNAHCATCHQKDGRGQASAYPSLRYSTPQNADTAVNMINMVLYGGFAPSTVGNPQPYGMPPYSLVLNDDEIANVLTYVRNTWGNAGTRVKPHEVNALRGR
ncbi:c-type cytochrome [Limnobacter sp.]|uniref:c-type cytochrome n=1 Tax=Limnobacter sp. TaxID=2003368 RepID=UPI0025901CD1|nr:c-type cytochrome [Limnobacter sp.]